MKSKRPFRLSVQLLGYASIIAGILALMELASAVSCRFIILNRASWLLYRPPEITRTTWEHYLEVRDPLLGWPSADALNSENYDESGSRPVPAYPEPGKECLTIYGNSFTYGAEVSDKEAWGNLLAVYLRCRVGNFGVPSYGTDQALLRFEANDADTAPVSILGIYPTNVLRNVTQWRYLRRGAGNCFNFKPRFILNNYQLRLVPMPEPRFEELDLLNDDLTRLLPHEAFLPGTDLGPAPMKFPYTLVVLKLLLFHDQVRSWLMKVPSWSRFLEKDHPSQALQVTVGIVKRFMEVCEKRGKKCFVLLFPTVSSYKHFNANGHLATQQLVDELENLDIPYLELTHLLAEHLRGRDYCEIVTHPEQCSGHLNAEGNRIVAEFVNTYIVRAGYGDNPIESTRESYMFQ